MGFVSLRTATREEAAVQHRRRVAAVALEIGRTLGLSESELDVLQEAAACHDIPIQLFAPKVQSRLLADVLGRELPGAPGELEYFSEDAREVISGFQGFSRSQEHSRLMDILWIADALDEHLEVEPYAAGIDTTDEPSLHAVALEHLRATSLEELRRIVPSLPVFPSAALKAITELVRPDVENNILERIAKSDPVLAGRIVSTANSALFAPRSQIRNLAQAISYIGPSLARHILLAAALRPAYSRPGLRPVWQHSLECAEIAGAIAELTKAVLPSEAVLAGLTHDIGMLALSMLGRETQERCSRLTEKGCPSRTSETVVYGFDHAEAGAEVLAAWNFPVDLIDGVRHHHAPEQSESPLGSILYLAEFCSTPDEDLPSVARLQLAASRIKMKLDDLVKLKNPGALAAAFQA